MTKPLIIVLVGYQEIDNQDVFETDERQRDYLSLWNKHNFSFQKFSSMIENMIHDKTNTIMGESPVESLYNKDNRISSVKPVIKWVGGKSKLLNKFIPYIINSNPEYYIEPFLGGGSVAIELMNMRLKAKYVLNDKNTHLINVYKCIKKDVHQLIEHLRTYENKLNKDEYYRIRKEYNEVVETKYDYANAARFMYLSKTCFRGLYRVNKHGKFNVPYGHYKTLSFDYDNIVALSEMLNAHDVVFLNTDYTKIEIPPNAFLYLDPPYVDTFDDYTDGGFNYKQFDKYINNINDDLKWAMSNSSGYISHIMNVEIMYEKITIHDRINSKKPNSERYEVIVYKL